MGDLPNKDKGEFTLSDPSNNDYSAKVDQYGSMQNRLFDASGAILLGQKTMTASVPVVMASDQTAIPVVPVVVTPPGTTKVSEGETATVSKRGGQNSFAYTIPNGETLVIQSFTFTGYFPSAQNYALNAKCDLYYRPNGGGSSSGQVLIATIYLNHTSFQSLNFSDESYVGDGTRALYMNVTNWSREAIEFKNTIRGYY